MFISWFLNKEKLKKVCVCIFKKLRDISKRWTVNVDKPCETREKNQFTLE